MLRRIWLCATVAIVLASVALGQTQKPNFDGAWAMDRVRSFGLPADMQQSMTVKHVGEKIEIETKLTTTKGETVLSDTFLIDGQVHDFIPQGNSGPIPNSKGKRKANWLPNGRGIVVDEVSTIENEKGTVTNRLTPKWTIASDGELIIDLFYDLPHVSFEAKRIFVKRE